MPTLRCAVTAEYVIIANPPACNVSEVTEGSSDPEVTKADFTQISNKTPTRNKTLIMIIFFNQYKKLSSCSAGFLPK